MTCGSCGGGFSKISQHHYGCSTARNKGTCDNLLTIRRDILESTVLAGLKTQLMRPDCVKAFIAEFQAETNRLLANQDRERLSLDRDLDKTEREIGKLIQAIKDGVPGAAIKDEMVILEDRRLQLASKLQEAPAPMPRLHPNLAVVYERKVADLTATLNDDAVQSEAGEAIRALIDEVRLIPKNGELKIELYGELAALINLGANKNPQAKDPGVQVTLVAGARNQLYLLFRVTDMIPGNHH